MKHSLAFRFDRFVQLLRNEFQFNHRKVFLVGAGVFAFLSFLVLLFAYGGDNFGDFHITWFYICLFAGGFIYTSISFSELNSTHGRHMYLTLPASTLEKFTSKWLLTVILFPLVFWIAFTVFAFLINGVAYQLFNADIPRFNPFNGYFLMMLKIFVSVQSLFLVGAVWFEKFELFKTIILAFIVFIVGAILAALLARIIFAGALFPDGGWAINGEAVGVSVLHSDFLIDFYNVLYRILIYFLWPAAVLLMWVTGFFKLKEKEG